MTKLSVQLNCPMPKLDFDIITLGHGSGGLLTHRLLDSGIFPILSNEHLDRQHDGAFLNLTGRMAFTTDSFVISPIFFPGGNIGELAVNGTVNDVAMCGAVPKYLSLAFILEEGFPVADFWEVLVGVKHACEQAGVLIVTGDTKVVEKGKGDKVFVNTTGIGEMHPKADIGLHRLKPGDKVMVSGNIGTHGVAILLKREGMAFESDIESDSTNLNHSVCKLLDVFGPDIHFLRDPTRGGVASVLNEIAQQAKLGVQLDQKLLPVDERVEGACEILGLDPLYVANEGLFLSIVSAEKADAILEALRQDEKGAQAAIIGEIVEDHPGKVVMRSRIGGRRVVNMLTGEQLPRIC